VKELIKILTSRDARKDAMFSREQFDVAEFQTTRRPPTTPSEIPTLSLSIDGINQIFITPQATDFNFYSFGGKTDFRIWGGTALLGIATVPGILPRAMTVTAEGIGSLTSVVNETWSPGGTTTRADGTKVTTTPGALRLFYRQTFPIAERGEPLHERTLTGLFAVKEDDAVTRFRALFELFLGQLVGKRYDFNYPQGWEKTLDLPKEQQAALLEQQLIAANALLAKDIEAAWNKAAQQFRTEVIQAKAVVSHIVSPTTPGGAGAIPTRGFPWRDLPHGWAVQPAKEGQYRRPEYTSAGVGIPMDAADRALNIFIQKLAQVTREVNINKTGGHTLGGLTLDSYLTFFNGVKTNQYMWNSYLTQDVRGLTDALIRDLETLRANIRGKDEEKWPTEPDLQRELDEAFALFRQADEEIAGLEAFYDSMVHGAA